MISDNKCGFKDNECGFKDNERGFKDNECGFKDNECGFKETDSPKMTAMGIKVLYGNDQRKHSVRIATSIELLHCSTKINNHTTPPNTI